MSKRHQSLDRRRWARVRKQVLDAANWRCRECAKEGKSGYANEVDHILPLHLNPSQNPYALDGLQPLCKKHHISKTSGENRKPDPARDAWRQYVQALVEGDILT